MQKSMASKVILKISTTVLNVCLNIMFYVIVVMLIVRVCQYAYDFSYQVFGSMPKDAEPGYNVEIQILKGESTMNIANKLETHKVIINKYSFYIKTKLKDYNIMPGTFVLSTSMDYDEILAVITDSTKSIAGEETLEE